MCLQVGATGFEPATPATPLQCATGLRHAPIYFLIILSISWSSFFILLINLELTTAD